MDRMDDMDRMDGDSFRRFTRLARVWEPVKWVEDRLVSVVALK